MRLRDEWEKTKIQCFKKIIFSMPKRLKHVIKVMLLSIKS